MTDKDINTKTVFAYVGALNRGQMEALRPLFTKDALIYGVNGFGNIDAAIAIWHDLHHGLNMHLTVDALVADASTVVLRYTETGAWTKRFLNFNHPTGQSFELLAIEWFEMKGGLIHRRWGARDSGSLARQVGLTAFSAPQHATSDA